MERNNAHPLFPVIECLRGVVFALVVLLLVQTFLAEGLLTPYIVSSSSMSPALRGPHVELRCPECATAFCIETGHWPPMTPDDMPLQWATCPVCAFAQVLASGDSLRKGDRIFVNRAALSLRPIRRWEPILFRTPDNGALTVKRVVGLPGETIKIRDGDIFIDGRIAVKPFAVQQAMRIPVSYGRWESQTANDSDGQELAWHPVRNVPHVKPLFPTEESRVSRALSQTGVTNQLCENQWRTERGENIFPVHDLMLEFEWQPESSPLCIRAKRPGLCVDVVIDPVRRCVTVGSNDVRRLASFGKAANPSHRVIVSLFDRELQLHVDGRMCCAINFDEITSSSDVDPDAGEFPFAFRLSENAGISQAEQETVFNRQIANPRIWRDVYYTQRPNDAAVDAAIRFGDVPHFSVTVPDDAYFVLGDNSVFSIDGRSWQTGFVTRRDLVGLVVSR